MAYTETKMDEKMEKALGEISSILRMYEDGMLATDEAYNKVAWEILQIMQEQGIEVK